MEQIRAYFDDYDLIVVAVAQGNNFVPPFTLLDGNTQIGTEVVYQYEEQGFHYYGVRFQTDLNIGNSYYLSSGSLKYLVQYRFITKTSRFDEEFAYNGPLGVSYGKDTSAFRLWAPTASKVEILINGKVYEMARAKQGIFIAMLRGDLDKCAYNYLVHVNGEVNETLDPYALAVTPNSTSSVVIDPRKIAKPVKYELPALTMADYLIYELSVFDYSNNRFFKNRGKYVAFQEATKNDFKDSIGLDYIKSLGVSHVQLMPILDFATKDDNNPYGLYNWGYDPVGFFAMEGSYSTNPADPYLRIAEVQGMIESIHKHQMRVTLDVVYNHVYKYETNALNQTVPYYYFGYKNGVVSNGSLCGNDLETSKKMVFRMISDSVANLIKIYGVDGIRIDLMGIFSKQLVDKLEKDSKQLNPSFIVYGEGWDSDSYLEGAQRASLNNARELPLIGFFNNYFRDNIAGHSWLSSSQYGYALSDVSKCIYAMDVIKGHHDKDFVSPRQSINFIECHDGLALADKIIKECGSLDDNKAILALAMLILAQGIPFLHCGEEVMKCKGMNENTYLNQNHENDLDWNEISRKKDFVHMVRQLVKFRQNHKDLFFEKEEEVLENVQVTEYYRSIICTIKNYVFVFNGNNHDLVYQEINDPNIVLGNRVSITRESKLRLDASGFVILLLDK